MRKIFTDMEEACQEFLKYYDKIAPGLIALRGSVPGAIVIPLGEFYNSFKNITESQKKELVLYGKMNGDTFLIPENQIRFFDLLDMELNKKELITEEFEI